MKSRINIGIVRNEIIFWLKYYETFMHTINIILTQTVYKNIGFDEVIAFREIVNFSNTIFF